MATAIAFPTVNVVPAGFRWTNESAAKAAQMGGFLRVGGPLVTKRFLSGATQYFNNANNCVERKLVNQIVGNDVNFDGCAGCSVV